MVKLCWLCFTDEARDNMSLGEETKSLLLTGYVFTVLRTDQKSRLYHSKTRGERDREEL